MASRTDLNMRSGPPPPIITVRATDNSPSNHCAKVVRRTVKEECIIYIVRYEGEYIGPHVKQIAVAPEHILDHVSARELEQFEGNLAKAQRSEEDELCKTKDELLVAVNEVIDRRCGSTAARVHRELDMKMEAIRDLYMDSSRHKRMIAVLQKTLKQHEPDSTALKLDDSGKQPVFALESQRMHGDHERPKRESASSRTNAGSMVIAAKSGGSYNQARRLKRKLPSDDEDEDGET